MFAMDKIEEKLVEASRFLTSEEPNFEAAYRVLREVELSLHKLMKDTGITSRKENIAVLPQIRDMMIRQLDYALQAKMAGNYTAYSIGLQGLWDLLRNYAPELKEAEK